MIPIGMGYVSFTCLLTFSYMLNVVSTGRRNEPTW